MKILKPEGDLGLNEKDWQEMRKGLEYYRERKSWTSLVSLAMAMKILASPKVEVSPEGLKVE